MFEYQVITVPVETPDFQKMLNELGRERWQLCCVVVLVTGEFMAIMMRRVGNDK